MDRPYSLVVLKTRIEAARRQLAEQAERLADRELKFIAGALDQAGEQIDDLAAQIGADLGAVSRIQAADIAAALDTDEELVTWLEGASLIDRDRKSGQWSPSYGDIDTVIEALNEWPGDIPFILEETFHRCPSCSRVQVGGPDGYLDGEAVYAECAQCAVL